MEPMEPMAPMALIMPGVGVGSVARLASSDAAAMSGVAVGGAGFDCVGGGAFWLMPNPGKPVIHEMACKLVYYGFETCFPSNTREAGWDANTSRISMVGAILKNLNLNLNRAK